MKTTFKSMLAVAALTATSASWAACDYPSKVDVPNGTQASKEQMMAGQKAIKSYMDEMNTYLDCIDDENAAAKSEGEAAEITAQREALLLKRHNAAIAEMEAVAANFNTQVRAYKAKEE